MSIALQLSLKHKTLLMSEPYLSAPKNKINLELPSDQDSSLKPIRLIASFLYVMAATSLGFLLSVFSDLHMDHQIVFVGLSMFLFALFGGYYKEQTKKNNFQVLKHPYAITLMVLTPFALFRIPYYSLVFGLTIMFYIGWLIWQIYKAKQGGNFTAPGLFFMVIIFIFVTLYLLIEEGYFNLDLRYILALPLVIFSVSLVATIKHDLNRGKRQFKQHQDIYLASPVALALRPFAMNLLLANIIILLSKIYISAWLYLNVQIGTFILTLPSALFFHYFDKEIFVWCTLTRYAIHQTIFRVHHRQFQLMYVRENCNRNIGNAYQEECLLCENRAVMVNFPCGHLVLCMKCWNRQIIKNTNKCLICSLPVRDRKQLKFERERQQGYDTGRRFIGKTIFKNQYFVQN